MQSKILDTEAAAGYMGVSPRTLEGWRVTGQGLHFAKLGKSVKYRQADVDRFIEDRVRRSTSDPGPDRR